MQKKLSGKDIAAVAFIVLIACMCVLIVTNARTVGAAMWGGYEKNYSKEHSFVDAVNASIKSTTGRIDSVVSDNTPAIAVNGAFERILGKRMVSDADPQNTVYKMDHGQLTFNYAEVDVQESISHIVGLYAYLSDRDMDMLYIQAPMKINKNDPMLPRGVLDTSNKNTDFFIQGLSTHGVPYCDLREWIHSEDTQYHDLFYNTDHHWKVETAFWAYRRVSDLLARENGFEINQKNLCMDQFTSIKYENAFLGTQGRRVGRYYGGVDDFTLLLPRFDTKYAVTIMNADGELVVTEGAFYDVFIYEESIDMDRPISTNRYTAYFGGDYPKVEIANNMVSEGSILILQDSYGLPFSAFMSLNFQQTDIIDLRHFEDQSLYEYLENHSYDMVIILYSPASFRNPSLFSFDQVI